MVNYHNNRNNFISKYNIKKRVKCCPRYIILELIKLNCGDHNEIYLTNDEDYILISSPYTNNEKYFNENNPGWNRIEKLYSIDALTFMKVVPMKKKQMI